VTWDFSSIRGHFPPGFFAQFAFCVAEIFLLAAADIFRPFRFTRFPPSATITGTMLLQLRIVSATPDSKAPRIKRVLPITTGPPQGTPGATNPRPTLRLATSPKGPARVR
jgi:hypothetical protein